MVTTAVVMFGWYVNGLLSSERDRINKQREITTQYLIEAYRHIEIICVRDKYTPEMKQGFETDIADIQLFGSVKQIELARKVVKEIEKASYSDPRYLLIELRASLRSKLNLEPASTEPSDIMHFRIWDSLPEPKGKDSL